MSAANAIQKPKFEYMRLPRRIGGVYSAEDQKKVIELYKEHLDPLVHHIRLGMSGKAYGYVIATVVLLLSIAFNKQLLGSAFSNPFGVMDILLGLIAALMLFFYVMLSGEIGKYLAQRKTWRDAKIQKLELGIKVLDRRTKDLLESIRDYEMSQEYVQLIDTILLET